MLVLGCQRRIGPMLLILVRCVFVKGLGFFGGKTGREKIPRSLKLSSWVAARLGGIVFRELGIFYKCCVRVSGVVFRALCMFGELGTLICVRALNDFNCFTIYLRIWSRC